MNAKGLTPILNVSAIAASFAWFRKWGWTKCWDWGTPPTFGAVGSGECEIFLCQGAQGGRGRGANTTTFQQNGDEEADKGVWMSVWVDDVDKVHKHGVAAGLEVTFPPTNMPWKRPRDASAPLRWSRLSGQPGDWARGVRIEASRLLTTSYLRSIFISSRVGQLLAVPSSSRWPDSARPNAGSRKPAQPAKI